jgi:hypothetical protein
MRRDPSNMEARQAAGISFFATPSPPARVSRSQWRHPPSTRVIPDPHAPQGAMRKRSGTQARFRLLCASASNSATLQRAVMDRLRCGSWVPAFAGMTPRCAARLRASHSSCRRENDSRRGCALHRRHPGPACAKAPCGNDPGPKRASACSARATSKPVSPSGLTASFHVSGCLELRRYRFSTTTSAFTLPPFSPM